MKVSNNTILITGGTSGIGLELVRQFHGLGNQLIVTSGNHHNLNLLKNNFQDIETIICDLRDSESVRQLINKCLIDYSNINIVINNAGIQHNYSWTEEKNGYEKIEHETRINFTSPMQIIYGLLPSLMQQQNPAIVNVSSGLAFTPKKSAPVYCATKAAIHSATKAIRYQLENTPVKVFEIIPPLVDTAMTAGRTKGKISPRQLAEEFLRNFRNDQLESSIGKVKLLKALHRIWPALADRLMKNG